MSISQVQLIVPADEGRCRYQGLCLTVQQCCWCKGAALASLERLFEWIPPAARSICVLAAGLILTDVATGAEPAAAAAAAAAAGANLRPRQMAIIQD